MTLNHRITVEHRAGTVDALGQPVETWQTVAEVWADVRHISGLSAIKAGSDVSVVKASIRIRYRTGLNAGMRVTHNGAHYDIKALLPGPRNKHVDLVCEVIA